MISASLTEKNKTIEKLIDALGPRGVESAMLIPTQKAAVYVAEKKLTGQVLKRQSGQLAQSVATSAKVRGFVASIGTDKIYGAIHEFGGTIRAKGDRYLRFKVGGSWASVRKVEIPKRQWLKPGVVEQMDDYRTRFVAALKRMIS